MHLTNIDIKSPYLDVMGKTYAEAIHIITNQPQKINNTGFNVVRSPTATYIHTDNYYVFISVLLHTNYKYNDLFK